MDSDPIKEELGEALCIRVEAVNFAQKKRAVDGVLILKADP